MVWYCKYQFRYIIGLWSQKWKKMCVSSRSPHLFFEKLFYWRAMSLSLVRLDSVRRIIEVNPMKFLSNVLKTSSTLHLYAEKKGKFRTVFQNILFIGQFKNCFIYVFFAARGKSKIETTGLSVKRIPIFLTRGW